MATTLAALAQLVQGEIRGNATLAISGAHAVEKAGPHHITYIADEKNASRLAACNAGAVVVPGKLADGISVRRPDLTLVVVENAQASFVRMVQHLRPQRPRPALGVSPAAFVSPTATIGAGCNIYPGAYIGDEAVLGEGCDVHPHACVGAGCRVGARVTLHPHAVLYPDVVIGDDVIVHAGAVIGADGFGYTFESGRFVKVPQLGTVHVHDDAEIGACTTIDRGMVGPTVVGEGTKLDNLVQIGHNCEIGKHNAYAAQVGLAGSVTTGDYVRCGGQVGVMGHVHLGTGSSIGAKSGVLRDAPDGSTLLGAPAIPEHQEKRIVLALHKLPELRREVAALQRRLEELTAQMAAATSVSS